MRLTHSGISSQWQGGSEGGVLDKELLCWSGCVDCALGHPMLSTLAEGNGEVLTFQAWKMQKIEINQSFNMGQEDFLVIIRPLACWFFKLYSVTNEQHTVDQNIPNCPQASAAI